MVPGGTMMYMKVASCRYRNQLFEQTINVHHERRHLHKRYQRLADVHGFVKYARYLLSCIALGRPV